MFSGFRGEFIDGDFAGAEVTHESSKSHAIGPGSRKILRKKIWEEEVEGGGGRRRKRRKEKRISR